MKFKLLDLGEDLDGATVRFMTSLCERRQAMSAADSEALQALIAERGEKAIAELPTVIPVKEADSASQFYTRLLHEPGAPGAVPHADSLFAALYEGDLDLPPTSERYCLLPQRIGGTLAASDLLS